MYAYKKRTKIKPPQKIENEENDMLGESKLK